MRLAALAALFVAAPVLAQPQITLYPGQAGQSLLDAIELDYAPSLTLGYGPARDSLYAREQQVNGELCGVYTAFCIQLDPNVDPSTDAYQKGVNAEHTWPQSQGAADEPSKSDLHHLFPAKANVNSSRSNHPYGEIPDSEADGWYRQASSQSSIPTVFVTEWSEKDNDHPDPAWGGRFEPREDHKGNAARAVFYFRAVHAGQVSSYNSEAFFDVQKDDLIVWHYADPVDLAEYARSEWIASLQGTANPFVLDSTLARRAFNLSGTNEPPTASDTLWVNEIHYDNTGGDQNEGVELAGLEGTNLSGWTLSFVNGNGGGVYKTVSLSGTIANQQGGYGTLWVPVSGVQNGGSDGIALVNPAGDMVEFVSYEGTVTASSGPASGQTSEDVGVTESSSTPVGHSLQLAGTGIAFSWMAPAAATPGQPNTGQTLGDGSLPMVAWINEVHYDNASSDVNEGVEIAGTAGGDLTGWTVALYNGSNGTQYGTLVLSGTIDNEVANQGALWFARSGLQNGAPDGLALVDDEGTVVQFLSYEGTMTAANGPAAGMTSENIGVSETSSTPSSHSLQLEGTGSAYTDFAWTAPQSHSRGSLNAGQVMGSSSVQQSVAAETAPEAAFDLTIYPNPVRSHATVAMALTEAQEVAVEVYDTLGRQVASSTAALNAGFQSMPLDVQALPAGTYVVRVTAGPEARMERLTVVR
ncbi:MAG: hypothetical protein Rubg2KO_32880 [Rubricoccaceae bacterium]